MINEVWYYELALLLIGHIIRIRINLRISISYKALVFSKMAFVQKCARQYKI
jgi:hypothetical protein